jgi:hypothetical protein
MSGYQWKIRGKTGKFCVKNQTGVLFIAAPNPASVFTIHSKDHLVFPRLPVAVVYLCRRNGTISGDGPVLILHHPIPPLLIVVGVCFLIQNPFLRYRWERIFLFV